MANLQDQELTHVKIAWVIRDIAEGVNNENVDLMKLRLDYVNRMSVTLGLPEEVINAFSLVYQQLDRMSERMVESRDVDVQYHPYVICSGRGRPRISISQEQLSFLVDQGFTVKEMSSILGVGQRTVERRLAAFDLSIKAKYSNINDEDLDELVNAAQNENSSIGIRMLKGSLFSKGYRIQREQIKQSLRTNPNGAVQ
ncbi:uncharacterized protein LOC110052565 [Paramuricea clavata]|uniref:Uncharacterized protein LOC110052565 n=1 Tax=Paramuricea clavata TaxID=317549 RepID=A0A7D9E6U2_PARCT|nr:uncharacterized protein LOC110052565 [Paramuricea clavata]